MKKIMVWVVVGVILLLSVFPACAEEGVPETESIPEAVTETEAISDESDDAFWQELLTYLSQSGADTSGLGSDTVEKLITLGEQFAELKEQGYTLRERLEQLITPENLLTTATAAVLVFATVFLFIMKSRQRAATLAAAGQMKFLRAAYETESEENAALRKQVEELRREQQAMAEQVERIARSTALNGQALRQTRSCSVGVANMVKDVFLNSRSLDHAGKDLMIRHYLKATEEETEEKGAEEE